MSFLKCENIASTPFHRHRGSRSRGLIGNNFYKIHIADKIYLHIYFPFTVVWQADVFMQILLNRHQIGKLRDRVQNRQSN